MAYRFGLDLKPSGHRVDGTLGLNGVGGGGGLCAALFDNRLSELTARIEYDERRVMLERMLARRLAVGVEFDAFQ